jgi:hypothetical protein
MGFDPGKKAREAAKRAAEKAKKAKETAARKAREAGERAAEKAKEDKETAEREARETAERAAEQVKKDKETADRKAREAAEWAAEQAKKVIPDLLDTRPRVFGVDGSGSADNEIYAKEMANSFIKRICRQANVEAFYHRGANALDDPGDGVWTPVEAREVVKQHLRAPNARIFLTGYSRGAAAVIDVAIQLKALNIIIEAMFLFDAVSRSARLLGCAIPNNVLNCYHVFRNPASNSRKSFGSCGHIFEPGVHFMPKLFMTTHGGMGANPWGEDGLALSPNREDKVPPSAIDLAKANPTLQMVIFEGAPDFQFTTITPEQEIQGMDEVESWMKACLKLHGLTL